MTESVSELIAVLCDETSEVRGQAETELVKMGTRAVEALIDVLRIDDHDIMVGIVSGVTCLGDHDLIRLYCRVYPLRGWGGIVPMSPHLTNAVYELTSEKNLFPLLNWLKWTKVEPRYYAMSALARIGAQAHPS